MTESEAAVAMEESIPHPDSGATFDVEKGNDDEVNDDAVSKTRDVITQPDGIEEVEGGAVNRDVTEITTQSYGSKVKDSCTGVCFGFVLYFVSITLLIWNEGRTVKRMKDLDEGREKVIEFDLSNFTNTTIPSTFENQLIHVIGDITTTDTLTDTKFGVSSHYNLTNGSNETTPQQSVDYFLKLSRSIDMYQWKESSTTETRSRADGSTYTETTYSYTKMWSSILIDSTQFREKLSSRMNPVSFPFQPSSLQADPIYLDNKVILNDDVISYFNWYEPLDSISIDNVPDATLRSRLTKYTSNAYYYRSTSNGTTSSSSFDQPNVGDARITFAVVRPDTVSIIGRLYRATNQGTNQNIGTHTTSSGGQLLLIERGTYSAEEMITQADNDNTATAWILRLVGFILVVFSILLILQPLATIVDIVPFVGDCIQSSMENCLFPLIAVIIALPTCLFVIALAWLAYRPYIAIPILIDIIRLHRPILLADS
jgi:Transmembrane protein 43